MATEDEKAAFRTMLAAAPTWSPLESADMDAFRAAGGAELVKACAGLVQPLPAATATAFLGAMPYTVGENPENLYRSAPDLVAPPCSYGQAAQLIAARFGIAL